MTNDNSRYNPRKQYYYHGVIAPFAAAISYYHGVIAPFAAAISYYHGVIAPFAAAISLLFLSI
jgi:hypothetical protein